MTEDQRPEAAKLYDPERTELMILVQNYALAYRDGDEEPERRELNQWLDTTLARHRMEARSEGLTEAWRGTWWDRNWFGLAFLGLVIFALLMIGLVNGWS